MRFLFVILISVLIVGGVADRCCAQAFGHFYPARTVDYRESAAGAYLAIADDVVGLLGQFRYGATEVLDFGLQIGFESVESRELAGGLFEEYDDTHLLLAVDGKYMIRGADDDLPVDISMDVGVGFIDMEEANRLLFTFGGQGALRDPELQSWGLEPYLGLVLVVDRLSVDLPGGTDTETDNDLEIRLGTTYELWTTAAIMAEIQAGNGTTLVVGLGLGF